MHHMHCKIPGVLYINNSVRLKLLNLLKLLQHPADHLKRLIPFIPVLMPFIGITCLSP